MTIKTAETKDLKDAASGYCPLDGSADVPAANLPAVQSVYTPKVITTEGDLIQGGTAGVAERLAAAARGALLRITSGLKGGWVALGASGSVLGSNGLDPVWVGPVTDNPIINPAMEIWQRGTSFAAATNGLYTADRWGWTTVGAGVVTVSQQTNVPTVAQAGVLFNYSLDVDVTTADASIAAGDGYGVYQVIEGYNWRHFAQRAFTVSFWVRDTITGEHAVSFRNAAVDRSYIATYTVNVADTWEYKTVTVSASPSAGTWDYINGIGLYVLFTLAVGSTFQTTAGAWQTGNFLGTATTVNSMSSTSNFFRVTGVKMELGSVATPLQFRSFQDELDLCKRYTEIFGGDAGTEIFPCSGVLSSTINSIFVLPYIEKRAVPTVSMSDVSHFTTSVGTASATVTSISATQGSRFSTRLDLGSGAIGGGAAANDACLLLAASTTTARLNVIAEL